jgi:hypothetical protein
MIMIKSNKAKKTFLGLSALLFSASLWAHGGAAGTDTDQCKFELEKDHWLHYTAYEPGSFPSEEFCASIPKLDEKILLVFDYQDQRYRGHAVEFEVTKEPEGTRVFFLPAAKHKSGTVELVLPNGVKEASKYLIHISLVPDKGEKLDAHMSFSAGGGAATAKTTYALYALGIFGAFFMGYLSSAGFKRKVDETVAKIIS